MKGMVDKLMFGGIMFHKHNVCAYAILAVIKWRFADRPIVVLLYVLTGLLC